MSSHWTPAITDLEAKAGDLSINDLKPETRVLSTHLHESDGPKSTPLVTPIYTTSAFFNETVQEYNDILEQGGFIYQRLGNPTCQEVESKLHALEGGAGTLVFANGMAAISSAITCFLKAGDHIILQNPMYSNVHKLASRYLVKYNIEYSYFASERGVGEAEKAIKPNTKMIIAETPCNPNIDIIDLEALGELGKRKNLLTLVDSTYASPFGLQPQKFGIDIVVHSGTKYIGGHSDLVAGVVTVKTLDMWKELFSYRTTFGATLSPFDASLLSRGLKTLHIRMERHQFNAQRLAEFLESHPKVERTRYAGLPSHPGHQVAKKQMDNFGGMISFVMKGGLNAAIALVENLRVIKLCVSLGGVESLMCVPAIHIHGALHLSKEDLAKLEGVPQGMIRFSVGIENIDDLLGDLKQALDKIE